MFRIFYFLFSLLSSAFEISFVHKQPTHYEVKFDNKLAKPQYHEYLTDCFLVRAHDELRLSIMNNQQQKASLHYIILDSYTLTCQIEGLNKKTSGNFKIFLILLSFWNYNNGRRKLFPTFTLVQLATHFFMAMDFVPNSIEQMGNLFFEYLQNHKHDTGVYDNCSCDEVLEQSITMCKSASFSALFNNINLTILAADIKSTQSFDTLVDFLQKKLSSVVKRVQIHGSFARGTAIKQHSDVDLLLLLQDDTPFELHDDVHQVIKTIKMLLAEYNISIHKHSLHTEIDNRKVDLVIAQQLSPEAFRIFEAGYSF